MVGEGLGFFPTDGACDCEDGVRGVVIAMVEGTDVVGGGLLDVRRLYADGGPAVGVDTECQGAQQVLHIAVGLVEVALLEFLYHDLFLHLDALLVEGDAAHAVGLKEKQFLHVDARHSDVEGGDVVVREGIVLAAGQLHLGVVVGHAGRAFKHQMF